MKRFTKFALTIAIVLFVGHAFGQSFGEVFNKANELLQADQKVEAANQFKEAFKLAVAAGEEGEEIAEQCKDIIPAILNQIAQEKINAKSFDEAENIYNQVVAFAKEINDEEVAKKAIENISQITMIKGDSAFNEKKYDEAIAIYKKVLESDPDNANAYLRIGMAEGVKGNINNAVEAYNKAKEFGAEKIESQIANLYTNQLKKAINAKNYSEALSAAEKAIEYEPNNTAYMYGGIAAYNLKNYGKAANLLKKAEPNANVNYYLAQSYEKSNNKAQACAYYKKLVNDAKFGKFASQKLTTYCK